MRIKEIMSKDIKSLSPEDSIEKAAGMMKHLNVGSLPVCRQNEVIGIVTDRDITLRSVAEGQNSRLEMVSEIMTPNPVLGNPDMTIEDAVSIMSHRQIRRLPIVEDDRLVGIVSLGDISVEPSLVHDAEEALSNISQSTDTHI